MSRLQKHFTSQIKIAKLSIEVLNRELVLLESQQVITRYMQKKDFLDADIESALNRAVYDKAGIIDDIVIALGSERYRPKVKAMIEQTVAARKAYLNWRWKLEEQKGK